MWAVSERIPECANELISSAPSCSTHSGCESKIILDVQPYNVSFKKKKKKDIKETPNPNDSFFLGPVTNLQSLDDSFLPGASFVSVFGSLVASAADV